MAAVEALPRFRDLWKERRVSQKKEQTAIAASYFEFMLRLQEGTQVMTPLMKRGREKGSC